MIFFIVKFFEYENLLIKVKLLKRGIQNYEDDHVVKKSLVVSFHNTGNPKPLFYLYIKIILLKD